MKSDQEPPTWSLDMIRSLSRPGGTKAVVKVVPILLAPIFAAGCVPWLRIHIAEGNPPQFSVAGSPSTAFQARVGRLAVTQEGRTLWEIEAVDRPRCVEGLAYGQVPQGFVQVVPPQGEAPPLEPGVKYTIVVHESGHGSDEFDWRGGRPYPRTWLERLLL